jgi:hypothetical protein
MGLTLPSTRTYFPFALLITNALITAGVLGLLTLILKNEGSKMATMGDGSLVVDYLEQNVIKEK